MNVRAPEQSDLEGVLEVMRAADAAVAGDSDWTASELATTWAELDLARDAWVIELDGRIAGYADFNAKGGRLGGDGYVHPEFRRRGAGAEIARLTEARAREEEADVPASERVYLHNATLNTDDCTIRPYRHPDEARAFYASHQESFVSHWEFRPTPWEEWQTRRLDRDTFDPSLWWAADDDGTIAGIVLCEEKRDPDQGWVDVLGVMPDYRRWGIADALLKTAFAEFFRRGERKVGLGVDAESPTGATRVYERAGMRTLWHAIVYEKELRPAS